MIGRTGESFAFLLVMALMVETIARLELVSPLYFPPISKVFATFFSLLQNGVLPLEVLRSLGRMGLGYLFAALFMIPMGTFMGVSKRGYYLFEPLLELLRPLPTPAIIPIAMLFLGIGNSMKVFAVFFACSFPVLLNTIDAVRSVNPFLIVTARCFGVDGIQLIFKVILPMASPQIISGLRTSLPLALIVTILSEMIGSNDGIGHYILHMQRLFSIPEMYAGVLMLGMVGFVLNKGFIWMDRTVLAWHMGWKRAGK